VPTFIVSVYFYSAVPTNRENWIEIPVPAIISEELFFAVQEQLDENRKHARQRRRGATYILQGLTVCGCCHYAYYGKVVSKSASKGKVQYAYYRCIGTDAYRFGGQRICDNKQLRTKMLDDLVWEQVIKIIQNPARLEKEYRRRLDVLERKEREQYDTDALKKQMRNLEKGKSRLIDSYADGIIDKEDFEPKIKHIKAKIENLSTQIQKLKNADVIQHELFLVINRIDEFAKRINGKLDAIDFEAKREIIRTLVKRIEIHKEEVVVVFRIEPKDDLNKSGKSVTSKEESVFMQDCTRRYITGTC